MVSTTTRTTAAEERAGTPGQDRGLQALAALAGEVSDEATELQALLQAIDGLGPTATMRLRRALVGAHRLLAEAAQRLVEAGPTGG